MGECRPETTAQLLSQVLDCLDVLGERLTGDTVGAVAVAQMRHWAELLQTAMQGQEEAAA